MELNSFREALEATPELHQWLGFCYDGWKGVETAKLLLANAKRSLARDVVQEGGTVTKRRRRAGKSGLVSTSASTSTLQASLQPSTRGVQPTSQPARESISSW